MDGDQPGTRRLVDRDQAALGQAGQRGHDFLLIGRPAAAVPGQIAARGAARGDLDRQAGRIKQRGQREQGPGQPGRRTLIGPVERERPGHLGRR